MKFIQNHMKEQFSRGKESFYLMATEICINKFSHTVKVNSPERCDFVQKYR